MSSGIQFDPEAIRALAQILKDTDLSEIEVVEKDSRIRVARTPLTFPSSAASKASGADSQTNSTPSSSAFATSRCDPGMFARSRR